jgi:hypothetical protein
MFGTRLAPNPLDGGQNVARRGADGDRGERRNCVAQGVRWIGFALLARYLTGPPELRVQHRFKAILDDSRSALLIDGCQQIVWQVNGSAKTPTEGPNG